MLLHSLTLVFPIFWNKITHLSAKICLVADLLYKHCHINLLSNIAQFSTALLKNLDEVWPPDFATRTINERTADASHLTPSHGTQLSCRLHSGGGSYEPASETPISVRKSYLITVTSAISLLVTAWQPPRWIAETRPYGMYITSKAPLFT